MSTNPSGHDDLGTGIAKSLLGGMALILVVALALSTAIGLFVKWYNTDQKTCVAPVTTKIK
jgi:hypothetical protein